MIIAEKNVNRMTLSEECSQEEGSSISATNVDVKAKSNLRSTR